MKPNKTCYKKEGNPIKKLREICGFEGCDKSATALFNKIPYCAFHFSIIKHRRKKAGGN